MKSHIGKIPKKTFDLFSQSMETRIEIGSIIAVCWDTMMHAGITLNPPLMIRCVGFVTYNQDALYDKIEHGFPMGYELWHYDDVVIQGRP